MTQFNNVLKGKNKQKETVNGPFHLANTLNSKNPCMYQVLLSFVLPP